jgi:2-oxoglutarate dehydrogenase E2 component (dihydrolipoamide succinyltransferase)
MAQIEIRLPKMGESVTEATITNWLKNIGDSVALDEPLVEVATDKVDNELPSEAEGILIKRLFEKDQVAQVGDVIAIISTDGSDIANETPKTEVVTPITNASDVIVPIETTPATQIANSIPVSSGSRFYSPLVRSIADKEGISSAELDTISGTGQEGRVTKKDILSYVENRGNVAPVTQNTITETPKQVVVAKQTTQAAPAPQFKEITTIPGEGDEIIEMDRMRKLIADHMVMSKHVSPHVTSFVEADVTNIVKWREKVKDGFKKREGENITYMPIFMHAIAKALRDFPMMNVSVSGTQIIKKKDINLGMATALPTGNLIVPVIKNADRLNLVGLTKAINQLAKSAREGKLKSEDIQGGTYTVSNQPQVGILALGAVRKMPSVIETPEGDFIGIRHKMFLSHSYDHRVVDGSLGGQFVRKVADYLEQFDINTEI